MWCGPMGSSILMDSLDRFDSSLLLVLPVMVAVPPPLLPSAWYPVDEDVVVTEELGPDSRTICMTFGLKYVNMA